MAVASRGAGAFALHSLHPPEITTRGGLLLSFSEASDAPRLSSLYLTSVRSLTLT